MNTKNEKETKENNLSAFLHERTATGQKRIGKFLKKPVFDLPHPLPPGQERCKQFPSHGPEELDL